MVVIKKWFNLGDIEYDLITKNKVVALQYKIKYMPEAVVTLFFVWTEQIKHDILSVMHISFLQRGGDRWSISPITVSRWTAVQFYSVLSAFIYEIIQSDTTRLVLTW